ncbi:hypothetical protein JCM31826_10140 [Thermaurantimonas aggregans]|uniref:GH16 domain-containing protein n=1 Tax=Thermaurantimonas aggregans TaxID=2173829 RepID=A0A401XKK4_9FLAO|nr:hypothetical protein [Thermaurantimonas aggregans]MCX8147869.1 hypothetical protein [Thermaurantimonas aggregans]GCD77532.1 hypothetical protein JCM31826_10140 [Thermaurantimonas aggregans]
MKQFIFPYKYLFLLHFILNFIYGNSQNCKIVQGIMGTGAPQCPQSGLVLFLDENFQKELSPQIWKKGYPWGRVMNHLASSIHQDYNIKVENGYLNIKTIWSPGNYCIGGFDQNGNYDDCLTTRFFEYTSEAIHSSLKFNPLTYIKIRFKIPSMENATFPAAWYFSSCDNEVDIFEVIPKQNYFGKNLKQNKIVTLSVHSKHLNNCQGTKCSSSWEKNVNSDLSLTFNEISTIWLKNGIYWYFNNNEIAYYPRLMLINGQSLPACQPLMSNFYVINSFPGHSQDGYDFILNSNTPYDIQNFPFNKNSAPTLQVDYVKIFKFVECDKPINGEEFLSENTSLLYGSNVELKFSYPTKICNDKYGKIVKSNHHIEMENIEIYYGNFMEFSITECESFYQFSDQSEFSINLPNNNDITSVLSEKNLYIYPNPFNSSLYIELNDYEEVEKIELWS